MMDKSVVIVGGGIGGLFTGAMLARNGVKVTVLEKNNVIGGGLQCFKRNGVIFETGMHVVGGMYDGGSLRRICRYLDILDKLKMRETDHDCMDEITFLSENITYRIPSGRDAFIKSLSDYFPEERENIVRYVDCLFSIADEVDLFNLRSASTGIAMEIHSEDFTMPADKLIARYVSDPKLRDLLAYLNPLYGGVAGHTPAYVHALINVLYINGSSRFIGGSQQLADALADVICLNGGAVLSGKEVTAIDVVDRVITGVACSDGTHYTADRYVSAIHPCHLLDIIGDGAFPKSYRNRLREIPNSFSAFSLFIELKPGQFPYVNHTCYYQNSVGDVWSHASYDDGWPRGFMYMTPPDSSDDRFASRLLINCVMDFDCVEQWRDTTVGNRGEDYERWKAEVTDRVLDRMEKLHPGFRGMIKHVYSASPLTIRDYFNTKNGALYGYRKDSENMMLSQLPIYTKVKNLLLTGQNVNLHGMCGVPLTAIMTAEAILGEGAILNAINRPD